MDHSKHKIGGYGKGGVRIYLWYDLFATIKNNIPAIDEQTAIFRVLQFADNEIQILKNKMEKLKRQKKRLMQVLLIGKRLLNFDSSDLYDGHDSTLNSHKNHNNHKNHSSDK